MRAYLFETSIALLLLSGAALAVEAKPQANGSSTSIGRADADRSGDLSFAEFAASNDSYVTRADADGDGKMTSVEIADEVMRQRAERTAQRIVRRFDTDGDGAVSQAEIEAGQKARFARLDKNKDGKLSADELPQRRRQQTHR